MQRNFLEVVKRRVAPYSIDVGILKDHYRRSPKNKKGVYAGGPIRQKSRKLVNQNNAMVSAKLRRHFGINHWTKPWKNKKNKDVIRVMNAMVSLIFSGSGMRSTGQLASGKRRVENAAQAVVRNPILRGDYGRNKKVTAQAKGFNRKYIDTAQFFRAITARLRISMKKGDKANV